MTAQKEVPASFRALMDAGRAARRAGRSKDALASFSAAVEVDAQREISVVEYAEELRRQGSVEQAEQLAADVAARHPACAPALLLLARCARGRAPGETCIALYRHAAEAAPRDPSPVTELAHEQRKAGLLTEADASYRAALDIAPGRIFPLRGLAQCARARGDLAASLDWNRRAQSVAPDDTAAIIDAAKDLRDLDRLEESHAEFQRALAMEPASFAALMGGAMVLARLGNMQGALTAYEQAQGARPADAAPLAGRIGIHRDLGQFEQAQSLAQTLLESHPAQGWMQIGWTERARADHAAAFAAFAAALSADPDNTDSLVQMAVEARALGQADRCAALFGEALAADPTHGGAMVQSALHALSMNRQEDALELFRRAMEAGRQVVQSALGACEALLRLGRTEEALAVLEHTAQRIGWSPSLIARRLTLLREVGEAPQALAEAQAALLACRRHAGLFVAVMKVLLLYGDPAQIHACLAAFAPATERERLIHTTMSGFAAEEAGNLERAVELFNEAVEIRPQDAGVWLDIARTALLRFDVAGAMAAMRRNRALGEGELRIMGHSPNVSQTHFGQMIDEYRMDAPLLAQVRDILHGGGSDVPERMMGLARLNPDSTLVAVAVLSVTQPGAAGLPGLGLAARYRVPRLLLQYWNNPEPPEDVVTLMHSWSAQNPGCRYTRLSDRQAKLFLFNEFGRRAAHAYRRAVQPAHKADLLRLGLLLVDGGIYADADDRCIAPMTVLVGEADTLVLHREDLGTLGNNFIAATPGHPVIRRAFEQAVLCTNRGDSDLLWFATGPGLLTRSVVAEMVGRGGRMPGLRILSRRDLHQAVAAHCRTAYKKTDRHWENTAFKRAAQPAAV